ncbi:TRAP transporter substrate-binding protein [Amorphus orientalis]|uniref:Tripartite ATP-independent transporter DctP family solute receptor n=1 Tax=Amorphus orientalis TaxID=649198 RepID=A0AAE3VTC7_9HYPH|nr:TRAP transporter substrate-binding protein [Amorphus orientalis]MDQ0317857.1 tripartite ATP-independent transporter DctP family solute receptor [Amorphus orientalis]
MKRLGTTLLAAGLALAAGSVAAQEARLGYVPIETHPVGKAVERFAELVAEKSDGRLTIDTYCCGTIGNEPQLQSSLQGGFVQLMVGPTSNLVGAVPAFGIFDLPFFYADFDAVDAVMDGPVGDELFNRLEEIGIVGLAYWDNGFRHMTNAVRPIEKLEDIDGLKIRVIPNPLFIETFQAVGANPVPLPYPELYNALESGAVEAQETPVGLTYSDKFYEVTDYLTLTGHVYSPYVLLASKSWFDGLSEEDRAIVEEAAQETEAYQRGLSRDAADHIAHTLLVEEGMEVIELAPEEQEKLRQAVEPVIEKFSGNIGPDLIEQARKDMAAAKSE